MLVKSMVCARCGNGKMRLFAMYYHEGKKESIHYCRVCLHRVGEDTSCLGHRSLEQRAEFLFGLPFALTAAQRQAVFLIRGHLSREQTILLHAVCGAGKTEIVAASIATALRQKQIIGWAIARKDVVIDVAKRLKEYYPATAVIGLYEGSEDLGTVGQINVLTTARLFDFSKYFNLLVVDENDAYPFALSSSQQFAARQTLIAGGCMIHISATILRVDQAKYDHVVTLPYRFHNQPLIPIKWCYCSLAKILRTGKVAKLLIQLFERYEKDNQPVLVFVPTKDKGQQLCRVLHNASIKASYVGSDVKQRSVIFDQLITRKLDVLITTTILERGITFFDVQVIVMQADDIIFNAATLIQVAGRVGRAPLATTGDVWFLYEDGISYAMKLTRKYHEQANKGKVLFL